MRTKKRNPYLVRNPKYYFPFKNEQQQQKCNKFPLKWFKDWEEKEKKKMWHASHYSIQKNLRRVCPSALPGTLSYINLLFLILGTSSSPESGKEVAIKYWHNKLKI